MVGAQEFAPLPLRKGADNHRGTLAGTGRCAGLAVGMSQKIGIHLSFWQTSWSDDVLPFIGAAQQAGFDGVEFPLLQPENFNLAAAQEMLAKHAMQATCGTGLSPATDITHEDRAIREAGLRHLRACLELADALKSPVLAGVTYTAWGTFPDNNMASYRRRCIDSLREAGKIAGDLGVSLCLEVLNRFEGYLFNTVEAGLDVLAEVGSPHIKLHLDTFHLNIEEAQIDEAIRLAGSALGHFHASENNRRRPGAGHIPWPTIARTLDKIAYTGWVVMESFVRPEGEVGRSLSIWRSLAENRQEEARQGAEFLKKTFR